MMKWLIPSVLLVCLSGCGQTAYEIPDTGATLEGAITFEGKPVPLALIIVRSETATSDAIVREAGRYKVPSVPLGQVKIGIDTDAVRGEIVSRSMAQSYKGPDGKATAGPGTSLAFIPIPKKFADPATSGITAEIKKGDNTLDITLTK